MADERCIQNPIFIAKVTKLDLYYVPLVSVSLYCLMLSYVFCKLCAINNKLETYATKAFFQNIFLHHAPKNVAY